MIEFLKISSMAIFDEIEIEFSSGLNCITGETGAGKSLILDALTLLMGARASKDIIRPGCDKTVIEALFNASNEDKVLRREIYPTGSNRCYIDGKLTSANVLTEASSSLINIYGQHEYQDLLNPKQHMKILEDYAGIKRADVELSFKNYLEAMTLYKDLISKIESFKLEQDYVQHCLRELEEAEIEEGIEERLNQEIQMLKRGSDLKQTALAVQELIYTGTNSITDLASEASQNLKRIAMHDRSAQSLIESIETVIAEIEEIHVDLRKRIDLYNYDPQHIEQIEDRLNSLRELKRKHNTDENGLLLLIKNLKNKLSIINDSEEGIELAEKNVRESLNEYKGTVKFFLQKRLQASENLIKNINVNLKDLGMPGTDFRVHQNNVDEIDTKFLDESGNAASPTALLKGEFFISTNVGQNVLPLSKIASGGELSRIMLAIKLQQKTSSDSTIIFDEIDAGISGQTAIAIANKLKELSTNSQTIVVTHLHQVASTADLHLVVTKKSDAISTVSSLKRVRGTERVAELARMMGGDYPSVNVIEHAKELVRTQESLSS